MYKIGGIEFNQNDYDILLFNYLNNNKKFIIKYKEVYQLRYSNNCGGLYATLIYKQPKNDRLPLTKRGRFILGNAKLVNDLIGRELVVD